MLEPGKKLNQRYAIRRVLARGLLSNVYEAEDTAIQRRVVLKEVVSENERARTARIEREVALYSRLQHPNVLPLLDVVVAEGNVFLVFPFIEGPTLDEVVQRGPLEMSLALAYSRDIASALAFVHGQKIIHRDLKPANILIDEGRPVLADFGIAKESDSEQRLALTRSGQTLGTPLYMAPEAMQNESIAAPADVYSLGVVMFELFAGRPPFAGRNFAELVANRMKTTPPPLVQVRADVPAAVSVLVQQMLSTTPATRPTAAQVFDALNNILATTTVGSAPPFAGPGLTVPAPAPPVAARPLAATLQIPSRTPESYEERHDRPAPLPSAPPFQPPPPPMPVAPAWPGPPPSAPARPWARTLSQTVEHDDLSRTVAVSDHEIGTRVEERTDIQLRGFFNDELSRQRELQQSREFYRTQLSEDYGNLMFQAKISFALWVLFSLVGFVVFVVGIVLLYLGKWQEGGATLVSESIVVFIQKLFKDREDEFRERAAKKNRHVELGNLWNLAAQSLDGLDAVSRREKLGKLTDAIIDQVGR